MFPVGDSKRRQQGVDASLMGRQPSLYANKNVYTSGREPPVTAQGERTQRESP